MTIKMPSILDMFKAGLHFGHRVSRRHPKMQKYIFGQKNAVHIIDLETTEKMLKEALDAVIQTVAKGGTVLFLSTKKQAQDIIKKTAIDCQSPYINQRWLGGTFTNFEEIVKLIRKFKDLKKKKESGELAKYTKREQLEFDRQIQKLDTLVGGVATMEKLPNMLFIIDIKHESGAVDEARKKKIPTVALCDTNTNPEKVTYPIPGNDDAVKGIALICELVSQAVNEGQSKKATILPKKENNKK